MKVTVRFWLGRTVEAEIDDKYKALINKHPDEVDNGYLYEELLEHLCTKVIHPHAQEDDDIDISYVVAEGLDDWGKIPYLMGGN